MAKKTEEYGYQESNWQAGNTCIYHAFYTILHEPWAQNPPDYMSIMEKSTHAFLLEHGYRLVHKPTDYVVVAYVVNSLLSNLSEDASPIEFILSSMHQRNRHPPYIEHFGVYLPTNVVESKAGSGSIIQHPLGEPPIQFDNILLYKKS